MRYDVRQARAVLLTSKLVERCERSVECAIVSNAALRSKVKQESWLASIGRAENIVKCLKKGSLSGVMRAIGGVKFGDDMTCKQVFSRGLSTVAYLGFHKGAKFLLATSALIIH